MLVIGAGSIGAAVARRCRALGMRVLAVTRHGQPLDAVDEMFTTERLDDLLPRATSYSSLSRSPLRPTICSTAAGRRS